MPVDVASPAPPPKEHTIDQHSITTKTGAPIRVYGTPGAWYAGESGDNADTKWPQMCKSERTLVLELVVQDFSEDLDPGLLEVEGLEVDGDVVDKLADLRVLLLHLLADLLRRQAAGRAPRG